ncbi:hypothetical protein Bca4012_066405 [Brassica carinata]
MSNIREASNSTTFGLSSKAWKNLQITTVMHLVHSTKKVIILHHLHNFQLILSHHRLLSPSPGMNSFDLNINSEEGTSNLSSRPMGLKKAKRQLQFEEQFKQLMEQNDKLLKAITKGNLERNEIQRQKVEVAKIKEKNKILFADLNSITDHASRAYIESQKKKL